MGSGDAGTEIFLFSKKKPTLFWLKAPKVIQVRRAIGKTRQRAADFLVHVNVLTLVHTCVCIVR